jgi:CysZ protein
MRATFGFVEEAPRTLRRPGFGAGVGAVFAGFGTIARTPSLWPWALVPVLVLALLEFAFIALAFAFARPWVESVLPNASGQWGKIGVSAVGFLAVAVLAVIGWFVAVPLAPPLSAPALEHIVRRVETELGVPPRASIGFFRELGCGFRAMAGGAAVGVPILALLWLAEFVVPPAAIVATPAKFVVSSLFVAWGLFDYPLTLRGVGFRERLRLMRENFACVLGFGLAFLLVFWVPCCGIALLSVGAAAATRLTVEIERARGGTASPTSPA